MGDPSSQVLLPICGGSYADDVEYAAAIALQQRLEQANPHLVYELRERWSCGQPAFYVRVASRAEPVGHRPRSLGPERAVAQRGHRELDRQLNLALA